MTKASTKTSTKSRKTERSALTLSTGKSKSLQSILEIPPTAEEHFSQISIVIQSYQNLIPIDSSSYIFAKCEYFNVQLEQTEKLLMTDDPILLPVDHCFKISCNTRSLQDLDKLVANPVIIRVFQIANTEKELVTRNETTTNDGKVILDESASSVESALSLYEALTGDVVERVDFVGSPSRDKKLRGKKNKAEKKAKKGSKGSKTSRESARKQSRKSSKESKPSGKKSTSKTSSKKGISKESFKELKSSEGTEIEIGVCLIDLLPLVLGKQTFEEFIQIVTPQTFYDDQMVRYSKKPGILVVVSLDKPIEFKCKPSLLHLTVESIYNTPSLMNDEMDYQICMILPCVDVPRHPQVITNGISTATATKVDHTRWPELANNYFNITPYRVDNDFNSIKNCVDDVEIDKAVASNNSRIEFNITRRILLTKEGFLAFYDHIRKLKRIVVEFYIFKKNTQTPKENMKKHLKSRSNIIVSESEQLKNAKKTGYLHLMAIVDLSSLIFPGVTKVRTAVALTTFHKEEALQYAGLEDSYFFPSTTILKTSEQPSKTSTLKKEKRPKSGNTKGSGSSKKSKKSKKSGSSKETKAKKGKKGVRNAEETTNMNSALPPAPVPEPPPQPSARVYNEEGQPTFVVLAIELTEPLVERKPVDDLHKSLKDMIQQKQQTPKLVLDNQMSQEFRQNVIKDVLYKINKQFAIYMEQKKHCHCEKQIDFITYLKRIGMYNHFLNAILEVAGLITNFKLNTDPCLRKNQNFIEEVFIDLTTEINQVFHSITIASNNCVQARRQSSDRLLFYAKEAEEMGNSKLAERYYLERLHRDNNADFWFDYAVSKIQHEENDKAFICLQQALTINMYHRNSLLLSGLLLAEKKHLREAELCLLTVMVQEPRWVEGWVTLYLFYKELENHGGMDFAHEKALEYLNDPRSPSDSFAECDDLAWTSSVCPNTPSLRAAILLLKMRMYSWVENALTQELTHQDGILHYLLGVICYYKKFHKHALEHLEKARFFHGSDSAVVSLTGHCYMATGQHKEALIEYTHLLSSFECPQNLHLVYLNAAKLMNDVKEARKLLLLACKHNPTPYTWTCCGIMYFKQNDFLSSEECFSESIALDNTLPDSWGYLTLINIKMRRISEAEICYGWALKNNLQDDYLLNEIQNGFKKLEAT